MRGASSQATLPDLVWVPQAMGMMPGESERGAPWKKASERIARKQAWAAGPSVAIGLDQFAGREAGVSLPPSSSPDIDCDMMNSLDNLPDGSKLDVDGSRMRQDMVDQHKRYQCARIPHR
jgi:hypothetical protein